MKRKIIVILGPTASGKTAIGVQVAKEFNGEIISADSRQVFRRLDIGSGKDGIANAITKKQDIIRQAHDLTAIIKKNTNNKSQIPNKLPTPDSSFESEPEGSFLRVEDKLQTLKNALRFVDNVPQWLIDIKEPGEDFNLFEFIELANLAIEDIFSRGKIPVVVGGTGLYIQGLVEGFKLSQESGVRSQENYKREELNNLSIQQLKLILEKLHPEALLEIDQSNPHRLIRAIERAQDGYEMIKEKPDFEALQIGINWPREILNKRIDKRVDDRFDQGMLEEVTGLLKQGVDPNWLTKLGLEYREITKFLIAPACPAGRLNKTQLEQTKKSQEFRKMSETLKLRIRQFAKRQTTWFKRFPEIVWENDFDKIKKIINDYLKREYLQI